VVGIWEVTGGTHVGDKFKFITSKIENSAPVAFSWIEINAGSRTFRTVFLKEENERNLHEPIQIISELKFYLLKLLKITLY
jgi:hypothetical protein